MSTPQLSTLLESEHHEIDGGIEEYAASLAGGTADPAPLRRAMSALRRHIYLEEEFVFPPLKVAGMTMPIFVMLREHGEIWDAMASLDDMLSGGGTAESLENACQDLLIQLDTHNSKEEPIIYPRADVDLPDETSQRLQVFLAEGKMPDGWRCEKATR